MSTRVYLAGPEVFLPDPIALYDAKKRICQRHGLEAVSPLDHLVDISKLTPRQAGCVIGEGNERHMRSSDLAIVNMTPFRSASTDVGTAYEMGFMRALGKPVIGYTNVRGSLLERTLQLVEGDVYARPGGGLEDSDRMLIEDFELTDNLMLDGAVVSSGFQVVIVRTSWSKRYTDLRGFEMCARKAADLVRGTAPSAVHTRSTGRHARTLSMS